MALIDALLASSRISEAHTQPEKKAYSERLSSLLAQEVADGLRNIGFPKVRPLRGGPSEKAFQGGLGTKKVDVSYADEQHGLLLAVSIKTIGFSPFGKNLKNRFSDLLTEAITLHMRFPYSIVCGLFAFPIAADNDTTARRTLSSFHRATKLLATVSGRKEYTDPSEKFENISLLLYQPLEDDPSRVSFKLVNADTGAEMTEHEYFEMLRQLHNQRNPHRPIGESEFDD